MKWLINPETLVLEPEEGHEHPSRFTAEELRAQEWPPCPVCGTPIIVSEVDAQTSLDPRPMYILGRWQCRNRCDPRPVLKTMGSAT